MMVPVKIMHIQAASLPSPGALLGTQTSPSVMDQINIGLHGSTVLQAVSDAYKSTHNYFIENVIKPMRTVGDAIANKIVTVMKPDVIRPIVTEEDLKYIPASMHLPIIMYQPVRELLEQGRISGFGYNPDHLPKEDVYDRLINNGTVHDVSAVIDDEGRIPFEWEFKSTDPILSDDELNHIEATREFMLKLINTSDIDMTDAPFDRG